MDTYYLGLDVGTTAVKAVAIPQRDKPHKMPHAARQVYPPAESDDGELVMRTETIMLYFATLKWSSVVYRWSSVIVILCFSPSHYPLLCRTLTW